MAEVVHAEMVLEGFKISSDLISFDKDGQNLDVHNNYNFKSFTYEITDRKIGFVWELGNGDWVPDNLPQTLHFVMFGVHLLKARERDLEMPFSEDKCPESIGFIRNNMLDEFERVATNEPEVECNHLLNFQSGLAVKIGAEKAALITHV